jgi:hypothetical protein
MSLFHAVVWTDHQSAQVLQFDAEQVQTHNIYSEKHDTAQHGSEVRSQHEFFADICVALEGVSQVLITGSHTALADFRHYAEKHKPQTARQIVAYEVVDHPTSHQLVALARTCFLRHDRMDGIPVPA